MRRAILQLCARPTLRATSYPVVTSLGSACPAEGDGVLALVQENGGGLVAQAQSGAIAIESVDGACITGSFGLAFAGGDELSGAFAAVICD